MKTQLVLLINLSIILISVTAKAQKSCCEPSSNSMQVFALNESFRVDHLSPIPYKLKNQQGKVISFTATDDTLASAYYIPSRNRSNKTLLVFHEWWGLNDYIKQEAQNWQDVLGDVNVYAINLYDGEVAKTPEEAGALMGGLDGDHESSMVSGLIDYAGEN